MANMEGFPDEERYIPEEFDGQDISARANRDSLITAITAESARDQLHQKLDEAIDDLRNPEAVGKAVLTRWDTTMKMKDGEGGSYPETVTNFGVRFLLNRDKADESERSYLSQAAPTIIRPSRVKPRARKNQLLADIPDLQYGFRRLPDGTLLPLHNPEAMDTALQVIKDQQPNLIILGGDELDLPELGKYPADSRHFVDTLQQSVDGLHKFLAQLRADNPNARIKNVDSNHIKRLSAYMLKNAMPLFGIRRANMPDEWPVMSYANLLRLDELEIEWDSGYPAAEIQINDRLTTIHGDRSNARGSTAAQYLSYYENSLMFHHTHRAESLTRTMRSGNQIQAFSFGSLTDNNGNVPSFGNAVSDRGQVVLHRENWQTGIGFVEFDEGDKPFHPHAVTIDPTDGNTAYFNGKEYSPRENKIF